MIATTIWNQLVNTLRNDATLSKYIKYVYEGRRYDLDASDVPCLMLEPVSDGEIAKKISNVQDIYLTVNIFAFSSNNHNEFPRTITGDLDYKGILDINNDVRACIDGSYQLGGAVIEARPQETQYDTIDTDKYPVRGMVLPIRILYRQQDGV